MSSCCLCQGPDVKTYCESVCLFYPLELKTNKQTKAKTKKEKRKKKKKEKQNKTEQNITKQNKTGTALLK